jgi:hypothetical protein
LLGFAVGTIKVYIKVSRPGRTQAAEKIKKAGLDDQLFVGCFRIKISLGDVDLQLQSAKQSKTHSACPCSEPRNLDRRKSSIK